MHQQHSLSYRGDIDAPAHIFTSIIGYSTPCLIATVAMRKYVVPGTLEGVAPACNPDPLALTHSRL